MGGGDPARRDPRLREARAPQLQHLPAALRRTAICPASVRTTLPGAPRAERERWATAALAREAPAERAARRSPRSSELLVVRARAGRRCRSTPGRGRWRRSGAALGRAPDPHPPGRAGQLLVGRAVGAGAGRARDARLRPVLNATGVVLHTNLGRAPLAPEAVARVAAGGPRLLATSSSTSTRASAAAATRRWSSLLRELTGAEDAHRGEQLRGGGAAGAHRARRGPRGGRLPRRAGGDRRRVPDPGRDAAVRRARWWRWAPPTAPAWRTTSGRSRPAHRAAGEGAPLELRAGGLHRGGRRSRSWRGWRSARGRAALRGLGTGLLAAAGRPGLRWPSPRCAAGRWPRARTWWPSPATSCSAGRRRASWWGAPR